jgi:3-hydroxybutyryl-CoA dehydrogenase
MKIALLGTSSKKEELLSVISSTKHEIVSLESTKNIDFTNLDVIFDLNFDDNYSNSLNGYLAVPEKCLIIVSSLKIQLEAILPQTLQNQVIGINALNSFISRDAIEYCHINNQDFSELFLQLGWKKALKVGSRVGLVSARVVLMIINEAYFTFQEGTANREDINLGLKLGTAYPNGPFEWSDKIGVKDVYEVLYALYQDTLDDRYKICSQLKTEYLNAINPA